MSLTLKIGAQDLSTYLRVSEGEGFDPYDNDWAQPAFSDAAFAEGHPLLNVDVGNRELMWPLYLKGVASGSATYQSTILTDAPVGYWRLGEPSGTTATDAGSGAHNGTYTNTPTLGVTGALTGNTDTAVTFASGSAQRVAIAANPTTVIDNFALECWVKLPSLTVQFAQFVYNGGTNDGWGVGIGDGGGGTGLLLMGTFGGVSFFSSGYTFADTNWHHVVMTRESGTTKFYVDGVQTGSTSAAVPTAPAGAIAQIASQNSIRPFNGSLDEVAVYNTALTSTKVSTHYNAGLGSFSGVTTAKDALHTLIAQINNEIANPTTSPLRVEWKDSGASNSTFYDVTHARIEPKFRYRLSEHSYADAVLHVWCAPPYGHTATERVLATAAGTAPGLTASLIGVASPLVGDVAPQTRVTVNTSGQAVGLAGRGLIVAAPSASGYVPFISAASFVNVHPSAGVFGASGAPGSQALYRQPAFDSAPLGQVPLGATMYAGRNRVYAAVNPAMFHVGFMVNARDQNNTPLGATAVAYRPEGWQLLDLGVVDVATTTPTAVVTLFTGAKTQTGGDAQFQRPMPTGTPSGAQGAVAGVYVLPEKSQQAIIDQNAVRVAGGFFGASGVATSGTFVDSVGAQWPGGLLYGASGAYAIGNGANVGSAMANTAALGDARVRAMFHTWGTTSTDQQLVGILKDAFNYVAAFNTGGVSTSALIAQAVANGVITGATLGIGSIAGAPLLSGSTQALVVDLVRIGATGYVNARWSRATVIGWIPTPGSAATAVPVACIGFNAPRTEGVPMIYAQASAAISYAQFDSLRTIAQPSEAYRLTGVTSDTTLRSPPAGVGPNVPLAAAKIGADLKLTPSSVGVTAVDWQLDGGPMNDPMGVEVRCRERFTYAR